MSLFHSSSSLWRKSVSSAVLLFPLVLMLGLCGCELPQPGEDELVVKSKFGPKVVQPTEDAAVLLVEDHLAFLENQTISGGPDGYLDNVQGLALVLNKEGVRTTVLRVNESETTINQLARFRVIYLADSIAIYRNLQEILEKYVRGGGVLVGIGEVARYDGKWDKSWPLGKLFGLKTRVADPWETGVSLDGTGLYQTADRLNTDRLLDGISSNVDWGTNSCLVWATSPAGAKIIATFPRLSVQFLESETPKVVDGPIPSLTIRQAELGVAIFCACLPSGRKMGGWNTASDAGTVLANALKYASESLVLPALDPEISVGRNQAAYEPSWPKELIVRVESAGLSECPRAFFKLYNDRNRLLKKGKLKPTRDGNLWKSWLLILDCSKLDNPGGYRLDISFPDLGKRILACFRVTNDILLKEIMPTQKDFFRVMRCGEKCHLRDPVVGGHHDATGDWAVRMWSMPHVVWTLARYLQAHPRDNEIKEELIWALDWCLKMQAPDGAAYASIRPPDDHSGGGSPIQMRPWQDKMTRELEERYSFGYTATYCAALAKAATVLASQQDPLAPDVLACAKRAFARIQKDAVVSTSDLGNRVWAAAEIYRATDDHVFLRQTRYDIPMILKRQLPPDQVEDADVYGDFFADAKCTTFSPQQWKVFHSIGIYLGLIEMNRILDSDDLLRSDIEQALQKFSEGYLLGMSSLTPYRQMANGLEPTQDGRFRVLHFSHPEAWVRNHGLNCDMLAMATVALELERDTGDTRLHDMALHQINWLLGANPLGYSMITGVGQRRAPLIKHSLGTGHLKGGIPNGIIGMGKSNLPIWGSSWDSREYWLPQNAYLVSTIGLLTEEGKAE